MDFKFFTDNLSKYAASFSPGELMSKIGSVAKKAGVNTIYSALVLYYSLTDPGMPTSDKLIITAALGYFILPVDAIPDFLPGGLVDDAGILTLAVRRVWDNINSEAHRKAKDQLKSWFGDIDESDIVLHK